MDEEPPLPPGYYVYALICISSALLTVTSTYRTILGLMSSIPLPEIVVSAVGGILQLAWNDLAYLVAIPLKSVELFILLPIFGAAMNFSGAFFLLLRNPYWKIFVFMNLLIGICISLAAMAILMKHGGSDTWRVAITSSYLISISGWLYYFRKSTNQRNRGASTHRR